VTERDTSGVAARRRTHVGRLLFELSRHFELESLERMRANGHPELTSAQKQVIVHLPLAGARLTDLAARVGVSKQAMMKLLDGLEVQGYVERTDDPHDARAKLVRFSRAGLRLLDCGLDAVSELEAEYTEVLGRAGMERLRRDLSTLVAGLELPLPDVEA
jgi:DNA-binding MarR family transcriptional regulator